MKMATKLEQAKCKLERLNNERTSLGISIREDHARIPFGQPNIIGRRDIYKDVNREQAKSIKLLKEAEKQELRIEMLEKVETYKEENELIKDVHIVGRSSYANVGARTSVNNLDYFRSKLEELVKENEEAKAYNKTKPAIKRRTKGAEITKLKNKISMLEDMQEKAEKTELSDKTKELIENGDVNQWKKKPIYYFVKGLKKVALEIDGNGEFIISRMYPARGEEDKAFIRNLLEEEN